MGWNDVTSLVVLDKICSHSLLLEVLSSHSLLLQSLDLLTLTSGDEVTISCFIRRDISNSDYSLWEELLLLAGVVPGQILNFWSRISSATIVATSRSITTTGLSQSKLVVILDEFMRNKLLVCFSRAPVILESLMLSVVARYWVHLIIIN